FIGSKLLAKPDHPLRRVWRWISAVQTDDPLRLTLNRAFAAILISLTILWALLLEMAVYGLSLASSNAPPAFARQVMINAALNLAGVTVLIVVAASVFTRALRRSIATNQMLRQR